MHNFMSNPNMENFQQNPYDLKNMKNNSEENSQGFYGGYGNYFNKQA